MMFCSICRREGNGGLRLGPRSTRVLLNVSRVCDATIVASMYNKSVSTQGIMVQDGA